MVDVLGDDFVCVVCDVWVVDVYLFVVAPWLVSAVYGEFVVVYVY